MAPLLLEQGVNRREVTPRRFFGLRSDRPPLRPVVSRVMTSASRFPRALRRRLPRLTDHVLDQGRLDLDRPELARNRLAASFRIETTGNPADVPRLIQGLKGLFSPGEEPELQQTYTGWVNAVVGRNFPNHGFLAIMGLEEAPMLDETVREWEAKFRKEERRIGRREGRQEGKILGMREVLLGQMALRFGRLPAKVRRQVEEISSLQELRKLGRRILRAQSLQEMGLGESRTT